ncbi:MULTISPECIES: CDP-alcohol phosphatidyltransferase family protein [Cryobacterium]|uniref:CDP-alcohol phosphatidyltransferase family protein n=1 Tax=Cryobacterium breve TaxID=1259258 RepID=A0ABY2J1M7_9MICO|nr:MULTISPECIES: CDP-alcohol phosphatidyltransferase family protein [Cryobacterium]TFC91728.1 CDP-alcohol phosphatidyltransferase family protein [Cryobacterium sp. TmT3-12]TFC98277.1 CDP-alcohol phosphatidyltransferase family protein [Cryobacterium breve]
MAKVHFVPISAAIVGAAAATLLGLVAVHWYRSWVPIVGWLATLSYLLLSTVFLLSGLRRRRTTLFGPANVVTAVRSTLVGLIGGMVVVSFAEPIPVPLLVALIVPALLLDAVDGWVARRTDSVSELGARFDMEVDAFLLLVLSVYVSNTLGIWVLAIGTMRYAFVLAGLIFPWFRRVLPSRPWRKVVTAVQGIALATAVARILPGLDALLVAIALALLVESFGRDVVWLAVRRARPDSEERDSLTTRTLG